MVMDEVDFKALWDKSFFDHCIFQFICMKINTVLWPLPDMWQSGNVVVLFWYWQLFSFFLNQSSIAGSFPPTVWSHAHIFVFSWKVKDLLSLLVPTFSFKSSVSLLSSWLKGEMVLDPYHPNSPHRCLSLKLCSLLPSPSHFMVSILLYNTLHSLPALCDCPWPLGIPSLSTSPAHLYLRVNQASRPWTGFSHRHFIQVSPPRGTTIPTISLESVCTGASDFFLLDAWWKLLSSLCLLQQLLWVKTTDILQFLC